MRQEIDQKKQSNTGESISRQSFSCADRFDDTNMTLRGRGVTKGRDGVIISINIDDEAVPADVQEQSPLKEEAKRFATRSSLQWTLRSLRYQWSLMTLSSKWIVVFLMSLFLIHVVLGTLDGFFQSYGSISTERHEEKTTTDTYAVVINTYRRPQMLRESVLHYVDRCGKQFGISQVFVLWADQETSTPDLQYFFGFDQKVNDNTLRNRPTLQFVKSPKDSLNSRFLPIPDLSSDALFMVDDDLKVSCESLQLGFLAWRSFQDSLVGYYPRLGSSAARRDGSEMDVMTYHNWPEVFFHQRFNLILTKASFLHKKYLELYSSSSHPSEIKEYVDAQMNCEDIAMGMLVANHTRSMYGTPSPPIYVEGTVHDAGLFGGISTGSGHMGKRSECLTDLTRIYKLLQWGAPLPDGVSLHKYSWLQHSPGYWWQHRPSNFFEWFAVLHFFL